ncbi:MAG: urease accessory protein UreF [Magnetospiraceae bacterium]
MTEPVPLGQDALFKLMTWLSPSFPVGGYTYSHGIEYAVEIGLVHDRDSLTQWIEGILTFGLGRLDADLFRDAWRAVAAADAEALAHTAALGAAMKGTRELALESDAQGRAFLDMVKTVWPDPRLDGLKNAVYPVAVGAAAGVAQIPLEAALSAFLHAVAANLISAGVRLIPLGQTDGQRAIAQLEATLHRSVAASLARPPEDLGSAAFMVDWTSMQHETQYTRLFRS